VFYWATDYLGLTHWLKGSAIPGWETLLQGIWGSAFAGLRIDNGLLFVVPPNQCFGFKIILTVNGRGWDIQLASDQNHVCAYISRCKNWSHLGSVCVILLLNVRGSIKDTWKYAICVPGLWCHQCMKLGTCCWLQMGQIVLCDLQVHTISHYSKW